MNRDPNTRKSVLSPIIDEVLAEQSKWGKVLEHLTESGEDNPIPRIQELGWKRIDRELSGCVYPPTEEERARNKVRPREPLEVDSTEDPARPQELELLFSATEIAARLQAKARFFTLLGAKPGSVPGNTAFGYWTVRQDCPALAAEARGYEDHETAETILRIGGHVAKMLKFALDEMAKLPPEALTAVTVPSQE